MFLHRLKNFRNLVLKNIYLRRTTPEYSKLIYELDLLRISSLAIIIAFEQPWALNWLLKMANKNLKNSTIVVFDNSRNILIKSEIEKICLKNNVFYFALPPYATNHINRSHGMAMSWIYKNVIEKIKPKIFAFFDHDLIPISPINLNEYLKFQPFFGRKSGSNSQFWSLWAGFCIFKYKYCQGKKINFLYDFSRGLDTGGANWNSIYSFTDQRDISFPSFINRKIYLSNYPEGFGVQFIDDKWIHIGSISYNNNFDKKFSFFKALAKQLERDADWKKLLIKV